MGTHPDFHIVRAMHRHRERAQEAEALLREVAETVSVEGIGDDDIGAIISLDLLDRINGHLVKGDR